MSAQTTQTNPNRPANLAGGAAAAAADAKPAPKPEAKPEVKTDDGLSLDFIGTGGFMLAPELATAAAPVRARSDKQKKMDEVVAKLHKAWVAAGKPNTWEKMVAGRCVTTYFVEPDKAADLHKLINRAVTFHGLRSRMGTSFKVTSAHVSKYNLPANYEGREAVSFAILDKRPRSASGLVTYPDGSVNGDKK